MDRLCLAGFRKVERDSASGPLDYWIRDTTRRRKTILDEERLIKAP